MGALDSGFLCIATKCDNHMIDAPHRHTVILILPRLGLMHDMDPPLKG